MRNSSGRSSYSRHVSWPLLVGLVVIAAVAVNEVTSANVASAQQAPAPPACSATDLHLSAYERTRIGTVIVEVFAEVARPCTVGGITAAFVDPTGQRIPEALELTATIGRPIRVPGAYVLATLVWTNWCGTHSTNLGPYGVAIAVDGATVLWPRLANIPFCRDRNSPLRWDIELAPEPTPLIVPGERLDSRVNPGNPQTWAQLMDHFLVYADDQLCGTFSLVDPASRNANGDAVFFLGRPLQSPHCSTPGALVCLETEARAPQAAWTMFKRFVLEPGKPLVLDNFAPDPLRDPGPQPTCRVPYPVPWAPDTGSGHAPAGGDWATALVALGGLLAIAGLAAGLGLSRAAARGDGSDRESLQEGRHR